MSVSMLRERFRLIHYEQVASTQAIARRFAPGTIVLADSQTAGYGRYGRRWNSPRGGLYASIVLPEDLLLPIRAGVAVAETLIEYGVPARLKWPNDVLVHEKKIAGILIEEVSQRMVLGIGVNLEHAPHPGSTCVRLEIGRAPGPEEFLSAMVEKLGAARAATALRADYRRLCVTIGREVSIAIGATRIAGRAVGIDQVGRLILATPTGRRVVASGECTHVRLTGEREAATLSEAEEG